MSVLESLPDHDVAALAETGRERRLAAGEILFRQGERASVFHLVLEGRLETTRDVGGEQVLMLAHGPGGYLGAMALLTDTPYRGSTTAVDDSAVFEVDGAELRRLAFTHPAVLREVLPAVEAVSATIKGIERDREKLYAVGKLAAGLAHELNNPAAAAARGVATLRALESRRQAAFAEIAESGAPAEHLAALASLGSEAAGRTAAAERLDPIAESDREQELVAMLERRGVPDAYTLASALTEARLDASWVDRIAALVGAVRGYSFLDQAARRAVDVHEGLESTLSLLGHEIRAKQIEIVREFEDGLPAIEAAGSELNQVWTNLIDNAVDALGEGGRITLRRRACSTRSSRPRPWIRAPASDSTSPSASWCDTAASCGCTPFPATPVSRCCCRSADAGRRGPGRPARSRCRGPTGTTPG